MPGFSTMQFKGARNSIVTTILLWLLVTPTAMAQSLFAAIGDYGVATADTG